MFLFIPIQSWTSHGECFRQVQRGALFIWDLSSALSRLSHIWSLACGRIPSCMFRFIALTALETDFRLQSPSRGYNNDLSPDAICLFLNSDLDGTSSICSLLEHTRKSVTHCSCCPLKPSVSLLAGRWPRLRGYQSIFMSSTGDKDNDMPQKKTSILKTGERNEIRRNRN